MFSMFFGSAEAQKDYEHHPRAHIERLASVAVAHASGTHATKPHEHHHHLSPAEWAAKQVSPAEFRAWSKVNICEEGGDWHVSGPTYSGGLGISNVNWVDKGGQRFAPTAATATPDEQIVIAERIQRNPPDQNGCNGSW